MGECVLEKINRIYTLLSDENSKSVFRAKVDLMIDKDESRFLEWFLKENQEIRCEELDRYEKGMSKNYILFGAGVEGRNAKKILEVSHRKVFAWCDNNRKMWGECIDGIQVLPPGELICSHKDLSVIITARKYIFQIYQQLIMMGFPRDHIIIPENGFVTGNAGVQYFDLFGPRENEVFVDAGCWIGDTAKAFVNWCKGKYNGIYAFEPDATCWEICEKVLIDIANIQLIKKGTWREETSLFFQGIGNGNSRVSDTVLAPYRVPVTSIDSVLAGREVSFIKMDVEGSELETLEGAKESIRNYASRLAVSVYHKPEDLWELAEYILSLNPDYKLYMRHYTTCNYETVLYAI